MRIFKKTLAIVIALAMVLSAMPLVSMAASAEHTFTITPSATTVKAGDVLNIQLSIDSSASINAIGYKFVFPAAFKADFTQNATYYEENEISLYNCIDADWYDEYGALKAAAKWGEINFGTDKTATNDDIIIFGVAKGTGISASSAKTNMVLGNFNVTIPADIAAGNYTLGFVDAESKTTDAGEATGTAIKYTPVTITVGGAPAPATLTSIATTPTSIEVPYANKDAVADYIKANITVEGTYSDASKKAETSFTVEATNGAAGTATVKVGTVQTTLPYTIGAAPVTMTGLEVTPASVEVPDANKAAALDYVKSQITAIKAVMSDSTKTDVAAAQCEITMNTAGDTVTVAYNSFSDTIAVTYAAAPVAGSKQHTFTITPSATTVKAGDVLNIQLSIDSSESINAIGYKFVFPAAFKADFTQNATYYEENEISLYNCIDADWYDEYGALKAAAKWGEINFGTDKTATNDDIIIFGVAKGTGISASSAKTNMVLGNFNVTIPADIAAGNYTLGFVDAESKTTDAGQATGTVIKYTPVTITVAGAPAPATLTSIAASQASIEVPYANKDAVADYIKANITVEGTYSDASKKAETSFTVEAKDGTATVKVGTVETTLSYTIGAAPAPTLTSIAASQASIEVPYANKDAVADYIKSQITVEGTYSDDSKKAETSFTVEAKDGTATVKVGTVETTLSYTIGAAPLSSISVNPTTLEVPYANKDAVGDYVKANVTVTAKYADNTEVTVPSADYTVDYTAPTAVISYQSKTTNVAIDIGVAPVVSIAADKTTVEIPWGTEDNNAYVKSQIAVTAKRADDSTYVVNAADVTVSVENDTATVTAAGQETSVAVTYGAQPKGNVVSIAANKNTIQIPYGTTDVPAYIAENIVVTATYENASTEATTAFTVEVEAGVATVKFSETITTTLAVTYAPAPFAGMYGDINGDSRVSVTDAVMALNAYTYPDTKGLTGDALTAADVDGVAGIGIADAQLILKKASLNIEKFPIEG